MRTHFIDPDFRPVPKTKHFCCVCQRDVNPDTAFRVRVSVDGFDEVVHPDDANDENSIDGFVGSDCAKSIPKEFLGSKA